MSEADSRPRLYSACWLTALLVAGVYLRFRGINEYHYSPDEIGALTMSRSQSLKEIFAFATLETNPPYLYVLRHYVMQLGDTPELMRGISIAFALLCIPVYYFLGKQQGGRLAGCVAAFLATFSFASIEQSQLVRNYTALILFLGLAYYYFHAFCQMRSASTLLGYAVTALLALMCLYPAVFAIFCMGAAGIVYCRQSKGALCAWIAVHVLLALHFYCSYSTYVLHNPNYGPEQYDARTMGAMPPYNALSYRLLLFVAYIPAAVSYFLHSTFYQQVNVVSSLLFFAAWVYTLSASRSLFYESLFALALGGVLLAGDIYPYTFRIGGRHAMWAMPYVILPVSLFVGTLAQKGSEHLATGKTRNSAVLILGALAIVAGITLNTSRIFFGDPRDYLLTNAQAQELRTKLAGFSSKDIILTCGVNVLYLLADTSRYYQAELQSRSWRFSEPVQNTRVIYTVAAPESNGKVLNEREYIAKLDRQGDFRGIETVWFLHTPWDNFDAKALAQCNGPHLQTVNFSNPSAESGAPPSLELIGVPYDVLQRDMIPVNGKYAECL